MKFVLTQFSDEVWRSLDISRYLRKSKDPTSAESYYHQLATGQVGLVLGENKVDFAIVSKSDDHLWISAAYALLGDPFEFYMDSFKELATQLGCKKIKWASCRPAYARRLKGIGPYQIESITYVLEI